MDKNYTTYKGVKIYHKPYGDWEIIETRSIIGGQTIYFHAYFDTKPEAMQYIDTFYDIRYTKYFTLDAEPRFNEK